MLSGQVSLSWHRLAGSQLSSLLCLHWRWSCWIHKTLRLHASKSWVCVLLQVLSVSPELQKSGEVTKVTAYTSDLIELVSGVCPVSFRHLQHSEAPWLPAILSRNLFSRDIRAHKLCLLIALLSHPCLQQGRVGISACHDLAILFIDGLLKIWRL